MEHLGDMGQVESCFGLFSTVLVSVQDRCTVCTMCTIGSEIILDAPDATLRRRGSSGSSFLACGDDAILDARWVHGWRRTYHRLRKSFWTHLMEPLGDVGHVEYCFGPFGGGTSIGARYVHGFHQLYHRFRNRFARFRWYS